MFGLAELQMQDGINTMKKMIGIDEEKKDGVMKKRTTNLKGRKHKRGQLVSTR
jgi:hypothetical protein